MIFSEIYSAYFQAVSRILTCAVEGTLTEKEMQTIVAETAFSESALAILPALKEERWQVLHPDLTTPITHAPQRPLTLLEKRWLRAILQDPRIRLFDVPQDLFSDVPPLFTAQDIHVFDRYADGDPFEDAQYIQNFRVLLRATKDKRAVEIIMRNRHGQRICKRFVPGKLEYSEKDDKFRVLELDREWRQYNVGRIIECTLCSGKPKMQEPEPDERCAITLELVNERKALERVLLHFAHFEKQAERLDGNRYRIRLRYYKNDETELVIRVLSFGPHIRVTEPESFIKLIKERLNAQKSCGLL